MRLLVRNDVPNHCAELLSKTCANHQVIGLMRETNLGVTRKGGCRPTYDSAELAGPESNPLAELKNFAFARRWDENVPGEGCD